MAQQLNFRVPANNIKDIVSKGPALCITVAGYDYNVVSQRSSQGTRFYAARIETDVKQTHKRERELKRLGINPIVELGK